jgi:tRNA(Ile2) C34 agmatinyltransferase TiaS
MAEKLKAENLKALIEIDRPTICAACGGVMVFQGLGQYRCEKCGSLEYDDYGKVREFIEEHPGANVAQIAESTGVTRKAINKMVKEERFEIRKESKTFLLCEICGLPIRSGYVCKNCEATYHKQYEEEVRQTNIKGGYAVADPAEYAAGEKRFKREKI